MTNFVTQNGPKPLLFQQQILSEGGQRQRAPSERLSEAGTAGSHEPFGHLHKALKGKKGRQGGDSASRLVLQKENFFPQKKKSLWVEHCFHPY